MPIEDEVLHLVPVGEENAVTSRLLWQQLGKWASSSVRGQLLKMAKQGLIQSRVDRRGDTDITLFFRADATDCVISTASNPRTNCE